MSISARQVKDLRDRTGAGMMDCKRSLTETDGNMERAVALLRERGLATAAKKAGRVTAEGLVGIFYTTDKSRGLLLELNCETDFVAKTDAFRDVLNTIGNTLIAADGIEEGSGETVAELSASGKSIRELLREAVACVGENITLRRFVRLRSEKGQVGGYVHAGGKIGVLVEVKGASEEHAGLLRSVAMQVAATVPRFVRREEVGEEELASERGIYRAQAHAAGKPENVVERIVEGRLEKYFREICLLEQDYVRDPDYTVARLLEQAGQHGGQELTIRRFVRYQLGEGIERKAANLAEEVAQQTAQGS